MSLRDKLEQLADENRGRIQKASDLDELNRIRVKLLGKKVPSLKCYAACVICHPKNGHKSVNLPTRFAMT